MNSDAGLVTGEYFLDHQLVSYQSQGHDVGIDLQYSSAQADPNPVVQYQFTTPLAGNSSSITSINAQVSLAGVVQGDATTYNTPDGLTDGETYDIPLQVDATSLPTGVYSYTMTVTENFGSGEDEVSLTSTDVGSVNVVNESSDPLGAGWSVGGLQQLSQLTTDGPVLITAGQQGTEAFQSAYTEGQSYVQDLALATTTSVVQVMANDGDGRLFIAAVVRFRHRRGHGLGRLQWRWRTRPRRRHVVDPEDRTEQRLGRLHRRQQLHYPLRLRGQGGRRRQFHRP